jgi:hypothetical protein
MIWSAEKGMAISRNDFTLRKTVADMSENILFGWIRSQHRDYGEIELDRVRYRFGMERPCGYNQFSPSRTTTKT